MLIISLIDTNLLPLAAYLYKIILESIPYANSWVENGCANLVRQLVCSSITPLT